MDRLPPRLQGDLGEQSALQWLVCSGAKVYLPWGHSPDVDMIADSGGRLLRVQVKTSTVLVKGRYVVTLATRGGNRSWNGLVKTFSAERCDYLLVCVADGRRWFIPAASVEGGSGLTLGGSKYAEYEVDRGPCFAAMLPKGSLQSPTPRRGTEAVKRSGL